VGAVWERLFAGMSKIGKYGLCGAITEVDRVAHVKMTGDDARIRGHRHG
jgi:hypothetical protein